MPIVKSKLKTGQKGCRVNSSNRKIHIFEASIKSEISLLILAFFMSVIL